jgi:multidrug efflux pump subunit AcrA (membrane-fusion protein)
LKQRSKYDNNRRNSIGYRKNPPEIEVKISSMVSGEIIALPVKEGQVVRRGDLLVKIIQICILLA